MAAAHQRAPHSLRAQAEFKNCEFVENSAQGGAGAVSLQDGAIGLFSKTLFKGNSAGQESVLVGTGQGQACLQSADVLRLPMQQIQLLHGVLCPTFLSAP